MLTIAVIAGDGIHVLLNASGRARSMEGLSDETRWLRGGVEGAIAGAEMAMLDVGVDVQPGSGVAAASNYWRSHDPIPKRKVSKEEQFYEAHSTGSVQG